MATLAAIARDSFAPELALRALGELTECGALPQSDLSGLDPDFLVTLANLLVTSPPMLEALRRHPDWLQWLSEQPGLGSLAPPEDLRDRGGRHDPNVRCRCSGSFLEDLRAFKRRAYLEIAFRDIAGLDPLEATVRRLSTLADQVIAAVLEHCRGQLDSETGPAAGLLPSGDGFAVFAMGKLGAQELNYSSDVDLVFCRRTAGEQDELRYFSRLGERLARALSQPSPDGSLYRVDMRLRPYGDSGPLVPTLDSLLTYFESWGEAWERQALLKARFVAGDPVIGESFEEFRGRFVFSRQMDDASLEEIKRVKFRSEKEYARFGNRIHIKHGPGGIRDIEFYVQFHQLVAGPRHPQTRSRSTLDALANLHQARSLLEGEWTQLSLAYRFLRILEHRLQLRTLTPQAVLPDSARERDLLARGLGYPGESPGASLLHSLALHRGRVREILERVYLTPGYLRLREREEEMAQLLTDRTPRSRAREVLGCYGFRDAEKAWQNLRLMAMGPGGRILPPGERRAFLECLFPLLEGLRDSIDPDQSLHKLESFAAATGNRVSFVRVLAGRRPHLIRLSNLLALSNLSHQILTRHPEYFDSLARGIHLHEGRSMGELHRELMDRFGASPRGEPREDVLRRFRQREMIRIAYRDLAGLGMPQEVSAELSDLAEACLAAAIHFTRRPGEAGDPGQPAALTVLGFGKLGSRQMHYCSDLDLVWVYRDAEDGDDTAKRFRLQAAMEAQVERLLEFLGGITAEGAAYRVDLRLRPEGSAGLLARSWSAILDYARCHMQPWERMALVRSRMLGGTREDARIWEQFVAENAYGFSWDPESMAAIRHLKRRLETEKNRESRTHLDFKHGKGGVADLDFLVQSLQLHHGRRLESVRTPDLEAALISMAAAGALPRGEAELLLQAHRFQRHVENHYQLMEEWTSREISRESPALTRLARSLDYSGSSADEVRRRFAADWDEHARFVRQTVERYFYQ